MAVGRIRCRLRRKWQRCRGRWHVHSPLGRSIRPAPDRKTMPKPTSNAAEHAAQGNHDRGRGRRDECRRRACRCGDEAGGLGTGAGGPGLGQILLGPLQQHGPVLHFGHLVGIRGPNGGQGASRSLVLASWSSSSARRSAITCSSTSTPRRAKASSSCRWRPISSSDSLAACTRG